MENRRRAARQLAVWMGTCQVEGECAELWQDCGVFDFSTLGIGMDLRHPDASALVGRYISVCLPLDGSMEVTFTGEVRNAKGGPDGIVRAGIEFVGLSQTERSICALLEGGSVDAKGLIADDWRDRLNNMIQMTELPDSFGSTEN